MRTVSLPRSGPSSRSGDPSSFVQSRHPYRERRQGMSAGPQAEERGGEWWGRKEGSNEST